MEEDPKTLEPQARIKKLIETTHNIPLDKNISISRYFHSGREMIKSAEQHESKEKLILHPEYKEADRAEKKLVKAECNRVFDKAEDLKKRIIDKYTEEYNNQTK